MNHMLFDDKGNYSPAPDEEDNIDFILYEDDDELQYDDDRY